MIRGNYFSVFKLIVFIFLYTALLLAYSVLSGILAEVCCFSSLQSHKKKYHAFLDGWQGDGLQVLPFNMNFRLIGQRSGLFKVKNTLYLTSNWSEILSTKRFSWEERFWSLRQPMLYTWCLGCWGQQQEMRTPCGLQCDLWGPDRPAWGAAAGTFSPSDNGWQCLHTSHRAALWEDV